MKTKDLRELGASELKNKATELKDSLFDLRMQLKTGRLDSTASIKATRRELARVNTVLREQELGIRRATTA